MYTCEVAWFLPFRPQSVVSACRNGLAGGLGSSCIMMMFSCAATCSAARARPVFLSLVDPEPGDFLLELCFVLDGCTEYLMLW